MKGMIISDGARHDALAYRQNLNVRLAYISLLAFVGVFVLCSLVIYFLYHRRSAFDTQLQLLACYGRVGERLNAFMLEKHMTAYTVICSNWFQKFLTKSWIVSEKDYALYKNNITHFLSSISSMNKDMRCVLIPLDQAELIQNDNSYKPPRAWRVTDEPWYDSLMVGGKFENYSDDRLFAGVPSPGVSVYYVVKSIYNFSPLGYFAIHLNYKQFDFVTEAASLDVQILIRDAQGRVVASNMDPSQNNAHVLEAAQPGQVVESKGYMVFTDTLMDGRWHLWLLKKQSLFDVFQANLDSYLLLALVTLLSLMISTLFTRQLKLLHLIEQNRLKDKLYREAELKSLWHRFNPHFLCNTLEILNGMILAGESARALKFSAMLGKMYRYDISDKEITSLRDEMSYVKNYLDIIRSKNINLEASYDLDENLLDVSIPKFIIQPIVENSIKHGFRGRERKNKIHVSIRGEQRADTSSSRVWIRVSDNGRGIPEEILSQIQEKIRLIQSDQKVEYTDHMGIIHTCYRLYTHYGCESGFLVGSQTQSDDAFSGTRTDIYLPWPEPQSQ